MNKEVRPARALNGKIKLPPDKSISHRSVMFAALHEGRSVIRNFSSAADPHSTINCMRGLGVTVYEDGNTVEVEGVGRDGLQSPEGDLDCGNSGTTMRLLSGIIAGAGIPARLVGDESLSARTMKRIIDPLTEMGAEITARKDDFAPLEISRPGPLKPLYFPLPIPSAQLKSCVLLAGLFGDEQTEVIETLPSRDHTERLLNLTIEEKGEEKHIYSSREDNIPEQSYRIPNDFSAAAFWLVAGAIHPNAEITLPNVGMNPTRFGALDILEQMGADITVNNEHDEGAEPVADLRVASSALQPVEITEEIVPNCIDEIPILMIAMLFSDGVSRISGAEELRHKETDRLAAMAEMLGKAGVDFTEYEDGLEIKGDPDFVPESASYQSYHDHRIAMSAAVLSMLGNKSSQIQGAECTAISYPSFWGDLSLLTN
ncbi:3-phosphoshikimate 1-carboxyvinyltransferase [Aliifodinibius salipaludis]|uniref:3-phosphoshikimate 1-carboxyvinyltransferase n=1 Tax=Fodinibius salipaludis TaxID=2032627 RepID=A0A2A2G5D5_9BACT|nr:3-phosphoshikimate 1-carboxyvinyltransferase [Aliifodinibius salipaludis]PAU92986.1 3-phosphoshikimate 1-carboxyvinyltransferase [Aliifodinibius salipaludis]